jgi:hypothetical protein
MNIMGGAGHHDRRHHGACHPALPRGKAPGPRAELVGAAPIEPPGGPAAKSAIESWGALPQPWEFWGSLRDLPRREIPGIGLPPCRPGATVAAELPQ